MPRLSPPLRRAATVVVVGAVLPLGACRGDSDAGDTERFCELVQENADVLRANPQTVDEIEQLIELYNDVGDVAPLAIEPDWSALTLNLETAYTSDDQEEIYARIYATERSSVAVVEWLQDNCAIDFGPVETIVPQAATTLVPPPSPPSGTSG